VRQLARVESEAGLQDACVSALRYAGYTVLQVGRWRTKTRCPKCGTWHVPKGGYGNETGTPDLLVGHTRWGACLLGIEMKAPGATTLLGRVQPGRLKPAQRVLAEAGLTTVCYSLADVMNAVQRMEDIQDE
jgi:hypothetical protein